MPGLIKSSYPDLLIPKISIWDLLFHRAKSIWTQPFCAENRLESEGTNETDFWNTRDALIDSVNGVTYKYNELRQRCLELSRSLRNLTGDTRINWKLNKDDVVALFSTNHIDYPVAVWATIRADLVMTAANPAYLADELTHQITDSRAKVLVTSLVNLPVALEVAQKCGMPAANVVVMDSRNDQERSKGGIDRPFHQHGNLRLHTVQGLVEIGRTLPELPPLVYGDEIVNRTAYLMYSSGGVAFVFCRLLCSLEDLLTCYSLFIHLIVQAQRAAARASNRPMATSSPTSSKSKPRRSTSYPSGKGCWPSCQCTIAWVSFQRLISSIGIF